MTELRVLPCDVTAAGLCLAGGRHWAAAHSIDFRRFIKEGLPVEDFRRLNDAYANRLVEAAERRAAQEGA